MEDLNQLTRAIIAEIQAEGRVFIASTVLNGQTVIRACIVNFRTTEADLDILLDEVERAGQKVVWRRSLIEPPPRQRSYEFICTLMLQH